MSPQKTLQTVKNQALSTLEFIKNENKSYETKLKYLQGMYLSYFIETYEEILKIRADFGGTKNPMWDEIYGRYMDLKELKKNL